jgi:glutathione S-transferase
MEPIMPLEFFWVSGSCNAWRVHLALEIKRVPYESRLLQFSKKEHKTPDFLSINPRGKVPAIRDGEFTLGESLAILLYLERRHPDPPLLGRTPEEAGRIMRQVLDAISFLEPLVDRIAIPIYRNAVDGHTGEIEAAARELHPELARLEAAVAEGAFLVGPSISAADCTVFPFLQQLLRASGKEAARSLDLGFLPLEGRYPALSRWVQRIEALPGYERTYPPHWR